MHNENLKKKLENLEMVTINSVYCLSPSEMWHYILAEKLYFVAGVHMYCDKTK